MGSLLCAFGADLLVRARSRDNELRGVADAVLGAVFYALGWLLALVFDPWPDDEPDDPATLA